MDFSFPDYLKSLGQGEPILQRTKIDLNFFILIVEQVVMSQSLFGNGLRTRLKGIGYYWYYSK